MNARWKTVHDVLVSRSNPSEVKRMAKERNQQATIHDKNLRKLTPGQFFAAAIDDGTNTIFK
jgi:hypothetical protein